MSPLTIASASSRALRDLSTPDVSFVIVNWNVARLLRDCLRSIAARVHGVSHEIVVVDNASSDDSVSLVRMEFPNVRLIENRENVGFARANNHGFRAARGRYVFILNPDTLLAREGSVESMVAFLDQHDAAGVVGPRLCYPDGQVQPPCARRLPSLMEVLVLDALLLDRVPGIGKLVSSLLRPYSFEVTQEVEAVSGAAMLVRRSILDAVGGFGHSFIHCGEDLDLCYRVRKQGWTIWYLSSAEVIHFGGQSSGQDLDRTIVNSFLSFGEYFLRCKGPFAALAFRLLILLVWVPGNLLRGIGKLVLGRESWLAFRARLRRVRMLLAWKAVR